MATAQLIRPAAALHADAPVPIASGRRAPQLLAGILLAIVLYTAFAHGAVDGTTQARLQVVLSVLAALVAGAWLWTGSLRVAAPRLALVGIGLLIAFGAWTGLSLLWSVAPDQTWLELNRVMSYVLVLCLALTLGASHRRAIELVAGGFLVVVLAVTVYDLGQKVIPGLHVTGLFNLNQTGPLPRLQEPFGYWNALALFIAMGVPIALMLTLDRMRSRRVRLGSLVSLQLMVVTVALTYSRGGLLALVVALAVGIALTRALLRGLMWLAAGCAAAVPPLVVGLTNHSLTATGVSLGSREGAGALLAGMLAASILALVAGGSRLCQLESRVQLSAEQTRTIHRSLWGGVAAAAVVALLVVSLTGRGLDGAVSHAWKSFTTTRATSISDPHRLLSADSENRWVWWKEAAGAFSDRPLAGWGAGSFGAVHLLYRRDSLTVNQPHSVPLQWLVETGVVGGVLGVGALGVLLCAALGAVKRRTTGSERLLAVALLAATFAYAVHALYDWDWDIPGVTLPVLLFVGVLLGAVGRERAAARPTPELPGPGARALALGAATLALCLCAISAVLPSLAASKASGAVVAASSGSDSALNRASASASLASNLDPVSDAGPKAQATIALHRGERTRAKQYMLEAVKRDPSDVRAWDSLAAIEFDLGDASGARAAATRAALLDPRDARVLLGVVPVVNLEGAPPSGSATAVSVP